MDLQVCAFVAAQKLLWCVGVFWLKREVYVIVRVCGYYTLSNMSTTV
jgi:hypothetical protein